MYYAQTLLEILFSNAGVVFDTASSSKYEASLSTYSWTHNVFNASNRVLVVSVSIFVTGSVSSITYNGVNLTQNVASTVTNGIYRSEQWYLIAPATGSNTVTVNLSSSLTSIANAASYYNVHQTTPIEATSTNTGTGNPASATVTTIANNSAVMANLVTPTSSGVKAGGSGQNSRDVNAGALGTSALDDKRPINPAGATTITWNGIGLTDTWAASVISLQVPAAATAQYYSFLTTLGVG